jgi:NAD-dependent deacetylase
MTKDHSLENDFRQAAEIVRTARAAVALSGAGISTPSGIPDFRSPGSGLWEEYDPFEVASITAFRVDPMKFYSWIHPLTKTMFEAEPNPAHLALARLETAGFLRGVITQNIDGLHTMAGSKDVLEVHGHLRSATCISCFRNIPTEELLDDFMRSREAPRCKHCDGFLKPDAVLFGEQLPYQVMQEVDRWIAECDLMLVIGSSLEVTPVAYLPVNALNAGARLMIFNNEPTYIDSRADYVFRQDVVESLPTLAHQVLGD